VFLLFLKRESERDFVIVSDRQKSLTVQRSWSFLSFSSVKNVTNGRKAHGMVKNVHANGQERLGTNSGKRSRFKNERNTVFVGGIAHWGVCSI
jgi:hypothetical protein